MVAIKMKAVLENALFFENSEGKYRLFGVEYIPEKPLNVGFVFLPPIGAERNVIDTVQVNLARAFASAGFHVFRFDYYGTGDSDGQFSDVDMSTLLSDTNSAVCRLSDKLGCDNIGLVGFRFGALVADTFTNNHENMVKYLILVAPIPNGYKYVYQALLQSVSTQTILFRKVILNRKQILSNLVENKSSIVDGYHLANMNGFPLTKKFFQSVEEIDLCAGAKKYKHNCMIVHFDTRSRNTKKDEQYRDTFSNAESVVSEYIIGNTILWEHGKECIKICRQLNDLVLEWVGEKSGKDC
jgi:pimeloyl-ACP methyl ester carboxylesterase